MNLSVSVNGGHQRNREHGFESDGDLRIGLQHAEHGLRRRDAVVGHQQRDFAGHGDGRAIHRRLEIEGDFLLDAVIFSSPTALSVLAAALARVAAA